ncbi:MAG: hypothetical protein QOC65_1562 [Sphingomonadales bacterium]|nr:hypothetical protein [Sphingomonadales bacterium]
MTRTLFAATLAIAALAMPLAAQTPVRVASFDSLQLRGGGEIVLRHGPEQRVTLLEGDPELASIAVERDGDLVIRPCRRSCRNQRLRVEVVTPRIDAVAITGGGLIRTEGRFPARESVALAVTGGGTLDARALTADNVVTAVTGGGSIRTTPRQTLVAAVRGGGTILYSGDPDKTVVIDGGGSVTRDR